MKRYRVVTDPDSGHRYLPVKSRGVGLWHDPVLNKGTAFSLEERDALGLRGLLPPTASTMEQQLSRVYENFAHQPSDLAKYLYLVNLQDRNETLFYRLLAEHLEEMTPIVYAPVVGQACERFSHIYRRPRGLYITGADIGRMDQVLANAGFDDIVPVIVATDGGGILGIGDQGAGGMGISIGKSTLYTVGAGIHPGRCLPISIDVGTNNAELRDDPLYLGVRGPRQRGERYFEILDAFVDAVTRTFPHVVLQWEDLSRPVAWAVLERYRDRLCSFNDDLQGTGAVVMAGIEVACDIAKRPLEDHRFCVHGAGAAGGGIIGVVTAALKEQGLTAAEARDRFVALDTRGVVLSDRPGLEPFKQTFAREPGLVADWDLEYPGGSIGLNDVVSNFRPTMLIGSSGQPGVFSDRIVRQMGENAERPAIFALSNPTSKTEVHPADALAWTEGRALVATGSPFPPVEYANRTWEIGQGNNVLCFPGIGLGTLAAGARRVTDAMLLAAAGAVAGQVSRADREASLLYPRIGGMRWVAREVAQAVAEAALASGAVDDAEAEALTPEILADRIDDEIWWPEYVPYRAVD